MTTGLLLVLAVAVLAQDGPVPPQRVDPSSMPRPASTDPVPPVGMPTDRPEAQEDEPETARPGQQSSRIDWRATPPQPRQHRPASIFTDENYRRARVRSLLLAALERRG